MVVVSEDDLESILPSDVVFVRLNAQFSIGTKRNVACEHANGSLIAHWDDDDWSSPERIEHQVVAMNGADIVGYRDMPFVDLVGSRVWVWRGTGKDVCGTSMMYRREYWKSNPFRDKQIAEDVDFNKRCRNVRAVANEGHMVARFHADSTTRHTAKFGGMRPGTWADLPDGYQ